VKKGNVTGFIIFLVMLIVFALFISYDFKNDINKMGIIKKLNDIRYQDYLTKKMILVNTSLEKLKLINHSQTIINTSADYPLIKRITINYSYTNDDFASEYYSNEIIIVPYPLKEFSQKFENFTKQDLCDCIQDSNLPKCYNLTLYNWVLESCAGVNLNKVYVYNSNITKLFPYYLFNGDCVQC